MKVIYLYSECLEVSVNDKSEQDIDIDKRKSLSYLPTLHLCYDLVSESFLKDANPILPRVLGTVIIY